MTNNSEYRPDLLNHQDWEVLPKVDKIACRGCQNKCGDIRGDKKLNWAICKKCHKKGFRFFVESSGVKLCDPETTAKVLVYLQMGRVLR